MTSVRSYGPSLVLLATALTVLLFGPSAVRQIAHAQVDADIQLARNELSTSPVLMELNEAFTQVSEVVEPSVVHIIIKRRQPTRTSSASPRSMPPNMPERFREFFEQMPGFDRPEPAPEPDDYRRFDPSRPAGNGSGWVYDTAGHIITNHHVVENADEIEVRFADGTERPATVVETDPATDIAVLKVDMDPATLHPAALAPSPVRQGEIVFAFGSPLRFDFSMSQGIVSATDRQLNIIDQGTGYERFIQTDAAINRGNSGGPLTNIRGEVVGMNTAIAAGGGGLGGAPGFIGLGFAIPTEMVQRVADQIIAQGRVSRGFLGVIIGELDPTLAETYGYNGRGVLIVTAQEGGPAADAGVRSRDIITHVNGQPVGTISELRYTVASIPPLTDVEVTVFRDGQSLDFTVTLGELPERMAQAGFTPPTNAPAAEPDAHGNAMDLMLKYGMNRLKSFTNADARQLQVEHFPGVLVRSVRQGSRASLAGVTDNSVITEVMGQPVTSVDDLAAAVAEHDPDDPIRFTIERYVPRFREFQTRVLALDLPDSE
ncbi:MAG: trypsin-like peptidase domain-containing protein [Planctomycetota bacterium]